MSGFWPCKIHPNSPVSCGLFPLSRHFVRSDKVAVAIDLTEAILAENSTCYQTSARSNLSGNRTHCGCFVSVKTQWRTGPLPFHLPNFRRQECQLVHWIDVIKTLIKEIEKFGRDQHQGDSVTKLPPIRQFPKPLLSRDNKEC